MRAGGRVPTRRARGAAWLCALLACASALAAACAAPDSPAARGQQVYLAQCIACHNRDPAREGTVGPAIKGSSRELIEAKVLRGAYPSGYTPKRDTAIMQPMPQLAPAIPDLAAYLD